MGISDTMIYGLVSGALVISFSLVFFAIKTWIKGINEKFTTLFNKFDILLMKIEKMIDEDEFKDLEKRVRNIENSMNQCENCKFNK